MRGFAFTAVAALSLMSTASILHGQEPARGKVFATDNLVAWCIVPFDAKNRTPEDRAEMLKRLGFKRFAYDWRAEHLPTFERELAALKKNGIELTAVWFPADLGKDARTLLDGLKKHDIKTQLWVSMGGAVEATPEEQKAQIASHVNTLRPIAEEAAKLSCQVALYNHGGWFGEPENQIAVIEALKLPNVGIVYNQHHGDDHLGRFPEMLRKMMPHLLALNLNGMTAQGDRKGKKIMVLGQGELDLGLLKTIQASGYKGPIGILGHTSDDAELRLRDNLDGLAWLLPQIDGKPAGAKPSPRTTQPVPPPSNLGWIADGKAEYRAPPITVVVRARLNGKSGYNILIASDTKASSAHWELFTTPGNGHFTAYLPGLKPDHVHGKRDIADGTWHTVAMQYEPERVQLFVDGEMIAEQPVAIGKANIVPGGLAFGRLVEGGLGCNGEMKWARISRGVVTPAKSKDELPAVDAATLGLWSFKSGQPALDVTPLKNDAKVAAAPPSPPSRVEPPPGPQLKAVDAKLKSVLIDRSPNDAYLAVRPDGAGRLFVGGREAVFVFEPDGKGAFGPRRELFRFGPDSIIIGIEYRGDDLYVMTVNALYLIPEGRTKRDGLRPRRLLWGVPQDLHVSFHCLAWGPEGDLYLNHGDPLLNYGDWSRPDHHGHWTLHTQPDGKTVPYTGTGAVLRIRPDGTELKVVAGGLRGPVGLSFDRHWNLFTNDNDHESMADRYAPCRLLHVTPHIDFGWPRGWMASKSPGRFDLIEPVNSNMGRGVPCDQIVYDEPMIPTLSGNLLLCRWDRSAVTRFVLRPRGATFAGEEIPFLSGASDGRPTGIAADQAGRLFVTSHYLGGNVVSPHCVSDLVMVTRDGAPTATLGDETTAAPDQLWAALSGPSGEARRRAHVEILRRGLSSASVDRIHNARADDPGSASLAWLAARSAEGRAKLTAIVQSDLPAEARAAAVRALAEFEPSNGQLFTRLLFDASDPVRLAALGWHTTATISPPITDIATLAAGSDPYIRQTAARHLARRASVEAIESLTTAREAPTRLAGVLAAGIRLAEPSADDVPPKELPLHYPAGNNFFHRVLRFADGPRVDLADLGRIGSYTAAERWKAMPPTPEQRRLFDALAKSLDDPSSPVKSQAAYYLGLLRDPRVEPQIARVDRELRGSGLEDVTPSIVKSLWLVGPLSSSEASIERGPIDLSAHYTVGDKSTTWRKSDAVTGEYEVLSGGTTYGYFRVSSRSRQASLLSAAGVDTLWHNGRPLIGLGKTSTLLDLQPGSNDILVRLRGDTPLSLALRTREPVTIVVPDRADGLALAQRLKNAGSVSPELLAIDWIKEARTGDIERGRKLFGTLGCVKCHAITADQTGGGAPSLADIGRRFTPAHLVESILTPDKLIAPEFRATTIQLTDGRSIAGLVIRESSDEVELLLPDTSRRTMKTTEIEQRSVSALSPMPPGLVRTPAELRDLLTYLLSDHPTPP